MILHKKTKATPFTPNHFLYYWNSFFGIHHLVCWVSLYQKDMECSYCIYLSYMDKIWLLKSCSNKILPFWCTWWLTGCHKADNWNRAKEPFSFCTYYWNCPTPTLLGFLRPFYIYSSPFLLWHHRTLWVDGTCHIHIGVPCLMAHDSMLYSLDVHPQR